MASADPIPARASPLHAFSAALAVFIAIFSLLNLLGDLLTPGFDANIWWIDFRPLPHGMADVFLGLLSAGLLWAALRPAMGSVRRGVTVAMICVVLGVSLWNIVEFYSIWARQRIRPGVWVPFSAFVAGALGVILCVVMRTRVARKRSAGYRIIFAGSLLICAIAFPLAQMFCFGKTDYRKPADVIVVFGAKAHADGRPSAALEDRVRTACDLYRQGYARKLIFSGGPGEGAISEPQCMRRFAMSLGVADADIILDEDGLNTQRTVENTIPIFDRLHASSVLAVSHAYHLPRVKMTYARAGREVYTVPAKETYLLTAMPYLMAREVAGLWAYYLRPLAGR